MNIAYRDGKFYVSATEAAATLEAPAYRLAGEGEVEHTLAPVAEGVYADGGNRVEITVEPIGDTLFRLRRAWTNT